MKLQIIPDDMRAPLPGPDLVTIATERPTLDGTVRDPTPGADQHLPPARPAPVTMLANIMSKAAKSITRHFTQLYPGQAGDVDPVTGQPLSQRRRYGGQFSIRRLVIVNVWQPDAKTVIWVPTSLEPGQWPLKDFERVSAEPLGNVEVLFDFEDQYLQFLAAHNLQGYDPLRRNDEYPTPIPGRPANRFVQAEYPPGTTPPDPYRPMSASTVPSPDDFSPPPGHSREGREINPRRY